MSFGFYIQMLNKICPICKKEFQPNKFNPNTQIYCSSRCRENIQMKRWRMRHPEKVNEIRTQYRKKYRQKIIAYLKKWREQKGKEWIKQYNQIKKEISRFGRLKKEIFERDEWECQMCGNQENLMPHHIDGKGVNVPAKERNNNLGNLITVCKKCHNKIHCTFQI